MARKGNSLNENVNVKGQFQNKHTSVSGFIFYFFKDTGKWIRFPNAGGGGDSLFI